MARSFSIFSPIFTRLLQLISTVHLVYLILDKRNQSLQMKYKSCKSHHYYYVNQITSHKIRYIAASLIIQIF